MRVLAIRGHNLASLKGDFELDLRPGSIADAGLFAITGPTGSGKSTLLDAMCLALYGRTPRLGGGAHVHLADADSHIAANDPRNLLSRGCAEGWAECDFLGADQFEYRARWRVRRARLRSGGRLQAAQMTLMRMPEADPLGDRNREVRAAIEGVVGLNYAQFCRTVLLAQGDFAAFLRAPAPERARLLEAMTATRIYGRISQAVYRHHADLDDQLHGLRRQREALEPLGDEEIAALDQGLGQKNHRHQALVKELAELERILQWQEQEAEFVRHSEQAEVAVQAAHEAWARLSGQDASMKPDQVVAAMRPQIENGRGLSSDLGLLGSQLHELQEEDAAAQGKAEHALAQRLKDAQHLEELRGKTAEYARWLQQHAADVARARGWPALRAELLASLEIGEERDAAAADLQKNRHNLQTLEQEAGASDRDLASLGQIQLSVDQLTAEIETTRRRHEMLERLVEALTRMRSARTAELAERQGWQQQGDLITQIQEQVIALEATMAERQRLHSQMQERAGLEHKRQALVEGQPCPLCGATQHPWSSDQPPLDHELEVLLQQDALQLRALRSQDQQAGEARQSHQTSCEHQVAEHRRASDLAQDLGRELDLEVEGCTPEQATEMLEEASARLTQADGQRKKFRVDWQAAQRMQDLQRRIEALGALLPAQEEALARLRNRWSQREARLQDSLGEDWARFLEQGEAFLVRVDQRCAQADMVFLKEQQASKAEQAATAELKLAELVLGKQRQAAVSSAARLARSTQAWEQRRRELMTLTGGTEFSVFEDHWKELEQRVTDQRLAQSALQRHRAGYAFRQYQDPPAAVRCAKQAELKQLESERDRLRVEIDRQQRVRDQALAFDRQLQQAAQQGEHWDRLNQVIGSQNGSALRDFAQGLNLDRLLLESNAILEQLSGRYRLQRIPGNDLDLQVADLAMGEEVRSVDGLSGGESFLVSLALALGLAAMSGTRHALDTLFLDEGFGTLDPESLETALGVLDQLQAEGRVIGVISHVEELAERVGSRVEVVPIGGGFSRLQCST